MVCEICEISRRCSCPTRSKRTGNHTESSFSTIWLVSSIRISATVMFSHIRIIEGCAALAVEKWIRLFTAIGVLQAVVIHPKCSWHTFAVEQLIQAFFQKCRAWPASPSSLAIISSFDVSGLRVSSPAVPSNKRTWGKTTRVRVCGGTSRQTTDQEALLLRGRGCNSAGRPRGGRLRAPAKADYIRLSFQTVRGRKGSRTREEKKEGEWRGQRSGWTGGGAESIWESSLSFSVPTSTSRQLPLVSHIQLVFRSSRLTWSRPRSRRTFPPRFVLSFSGSDPLCFPCFGDSLSSCLSHLSAIIASFFFLLPVSVSRNGGEWHMIIIVLE